MKTTRTLTLLLGIVATFLIISCQKNDLARNDASEYVTPRPPAGSLEPEVVTPTNLPDCNTHCVSEGEYVEATGYKTQYWGNSGNPHWKTVSYTVYNTATKLIVKVIFTHSGGNSSDQITVTAFGTPKPTGPLASGGEAILDFDLPAGWEKCTNVPFTIDQEGQGSPLSLDCSYNLYELCGCETSFTGLALECGYHREAIFTFTSEEALNDVKIQGGLTNFAGGDAEVIVESGNNAVVTQWTPGGSTNRVVRVVADVGECGTITIRVRWYCTNTGGIITGSWSVKDENGVDLATAVEGLSCTN